VFATLGYPDAAWGMVKLTPEQQQMLVAAEPAMFTPVNGTWGLRGATSVRLAEADARTMRSALTMAFQNAAAPKIRTARRAAKRAAVRQGSLAAGRIPRTQQKMGPHTNSGTR
jgi:hypothetical protein